MSEPTFTPGPWNVAGFDSRINEERYFGIDTPRGQMIVESFGECDFNRKANAALISAAPGDVCQTERACRCFAFRRHALHQPDNGTGDRGNFEESEGEI